MIKSNWFRYTVTGFVAATSIGIAACGVSTQQEVEIGSQYSAEINRQLPLVSNAQVTAYVNQLGRQIARQGGRGLNYTFYVVNSDVVNAFAIPGGYIYVNRGLIERMSNMSELAGVLAHEIGHVEQRHGIEQMERMQRANLGINLAYVLMGGSRARLRAPSSMWVVPLYSRSSAVRRRTKPTRTRFRCSCGRHKPERAGDHVPEADRAAAQLAVGPVGVVLDTPDQPGAHLAHAIGDQLGPRFTASRAEQ